MNITMTEWEAFEDNLAAEVRARWPWLDWHVREGHCTVRTTVHSSACISGDVANIAEAARQIAEVRDALLFIHGRTADLAIWRDGECPCGYCSGKGKSQGSPCSKCGGTGKR